MKVLGGYGCAGAGNRTGRRTATAAGIGQSALIRNWRTLHLAADGSLREPSADELREAIRCGRCWWCGRDTDREGKPFRSLSGHWLRAHEIPTQHIRDILGVPKNTSFISEQTKALFIARAKQHWKGIRNKGRPRVLSAYGKKVNRQKLDALDRAVIMLRLQEISRALAVTRRVMVICSECGTEFWGKTGGNGRHKCLTCSPECRAQRKSRRAREGRLAYLQKQVDSAAEQA